MKLLLSVLLVALILGIYATDMSNVDASLDRIRSAAMLHGRKMYESLNKKPVRTDLRRTVVQYNRLESDARLKLLSSVSSINISTFVANPDLFDALDAQTEGCFNSAILNTSTKELLVNCYENFYPNHNDTNPGCVIYDVSNDILVKTSGDLAAVKTTRTNSFPSPSASLRYVATSNVRPINMSVTGFDIGFTPQVYTIDLKRFNQNGILETNLSVSFDMSTLSPYFYFYTIAYNGICGPSDDGKYILGTYLDVLGNQYYIIMKVGANASTLVNVASALTSDTGIPALTSFCQSSTMWEDDVHENIYHIIIAENSWNFTYVTGLTSQVSYWIFNKTASSLVRIQSQWAPRYIQGHHVDRHNGRVYTINTKATNGDSILQVARSFYNNSAVNKGSNLRVYNLDTDKGTLAYSGGFDTLSDGIQVRASADGSLVAVTETTVSYDDIFFTTLNPLGFTALRYAPSEVHMYTAHGDKNVTLRLQSTSGASPLAFCLAFSGDNRLAVGGQPTYRQIVDPLDGSISQTGLKDVQWYSIESN